MKIDHVALYCLDLEGMKEFFIRYFNGVSNEMYHNPKTGLKTYILSFQDSDARLELMTRPEVVNEEENIYRQGFIQKLHRWARKYIDRDYDIINTKVWLRMEIIPHCIKLV